MKKLTTILWASIAVLMCYGCDDDSVNNSNTSNGNNNQNSVVDENDKNNSDDKTNSDDKNNSDDDKNNSDDDKNNSDDKNESDDKNNSDDKNESDDNNHSDDKTDPNGNNDQKVPDYSVGSLYPELEDYECNVDSSQIMCGGAYRLECRDNRFYIAENCESNETATKCVKDYGCIECMPGALTCDANNNVIECASDGKSHVVKQSCGVSECNDGQCVDGNCSPESQFVYLIDASYNLLKFNPSAQDGNYLTVLFKLNCDSSSTPFSMAVDRDANAWVLYQNSSLYKFNTADANPKCEKINNFKNGNTGLDRFGMAFSLDQVGGETETLYIGTYSNTGNGRFGSINPENLLYTPLNSFPANYEVSPELTGTGLAKLFAFAPGSDEQHISEIDKATGNVIQDYKLPGAGGGISAWAFAHWGGSFYMFETVAGYNKILRYDIATDTVATILDNSKYKVVGAGVSTCAPTEDTIIY